MSKQTAVEWLSQQILDNWNDTHHGARNVEEFIIQAMAMEREQIIDAFDEGQEYEYQYHVNGTPKFDSETYFIETYKKGEQ